MYCGVCHSDIHQAKNEWGNTVYPCMPGHEVVGRVAKVGTAVSRHAVGDIVGVGCMIDSCRACEACKAGDENYCEGPNSWLATYNGPMVPAAKAPNGTNTYGRDNTFGGYSTTLVVPEDFVLKIPPALEPQKAAPLLCAGVTAFSPMRHWNVQPGDRVGIISLGGLGHVAVKLARALGAEVFYFTSKPEKAQRAESFAATAVLESDEEAFGSLKNTFDLLLSFIPEKHDPNNYLTLLKRDKPLVIVGALAPLEPLDNMAVAAHRYVMSGSLIGSIKETQEVLDFCAEHAITPDIEIIDIGKINDAYGRVEKGEVRFRYVIDMASL